MYKKITHQIQEEHYGPEQLGYNGMLGQQPIAMNGSLPSYVMSEETMLFRMNARTLWAKYVWGLLNYGISLNNMIPGTDLVERRLAKNAYALGEFIAPYYGVNAADRLGTLLNSFSKIGVEVIDAVKDNRSVSGTTELWAQSIEQIATFLNDLNPSNWPKTLIQEYFENLAKYWINEIMSRAEEDWTTNEIAIENLNKLVITGLGTNGGTFGSLADLFSRGIIAQFPVKFIE